MYGTARDRLHGWAGLCPVSSALPAALAYLHPISRIIYWDIWVLTDQAWYSLWPAAWSGWSCVRSAQRSWQRSPTFALFHEESGIQVREFCYIQFTDMYVFISYFHMTPMFPTNKCSSISLPFYVLLSPSSSFPFSFSLSLPHSLIISCILNH